MIHFLQDPSRITPLYQPPSPVTPYHVTVSITLLLPDIIWLIYLFACLPTISPAARTVLGS